MSQQLVGQVIDQFKINAVLGEGGMGMVYLATDLNLHRKVAIKFVHRHLARHPEFRQRFTQEARTVAQLNHPSIVQIFSSGYAKAVQMPYMVMEYLPKGSLTKYMKRMEQHNQQLELSEVLLLVAQIADALAYAHRYDTIHRDIKPDNILLKPIEEHERQDLPVRAVVTDFGLVKLGNSGGSGLTATGNIMGTLAYMSPEQCQGAEIDGRSDIYSLGIMLYQLVTGSLPFKSNSHAAALNAHINQPPPPPQILRPDLPPAIITILEKMLAKSPHDRYRSAAQVAHVLRKAADGASNAQLAVIGHTEIAPTTSLVMAIMDDAPPPLETVLGESDSYFPSQFQPAAAPSAMQGRGLEIGLAQQTLRVTPGQSEQLKVNIVNRGTASILCSISLQGIPADWVTMIDSLMIGGGQHEQLNISIRPPRTNEIAAGIRPIELRVVTGGGSIVGSTAAQRNYTVRGNLQIDPFAQLKVSMTTAPIDNGATKQILVVNEGNAADTFSLTGSSSKDGVRFTAQPSQVTLQPNESGEIALTLAAKQTPLFGRKQTLPFALNIRQERGSAEERLIGNLVVPPRIPIWLATLVGLIAIVLIGTLASGMLGNRGAAVNADETAQAVAAAETAVAGTLTAESAELSANQTATAVALTNVQTEAESATQTAEAELALADATVAAQQTAEAVARDSDGDGISDVVEEEGCTDPNRADTDNDGLSDAEERPPTGQTDPCDADTDDDTLNDGDEQRFGTDPLRVDTDGDSLWDGIEISGEGRPDTSNPLRADSDSDGIPDNVDDTPRDLTPTDTPVPTVTPAPTRPAPLASVLPRANWLPSRTRLIFVSDRGGNDSVYFTDLNNPTEVSRLSIPPSNGYDWWPAWCNEDLIIFERTGADGYQEIHAYGSDGTIVQLTDGSRPVNSQRNGIASCSPDGRYIAMSSLSQSAAAGNHYEVGMIQVDVDNPQFEPLGGGQRFGGNITWSPDSRSVVFMQFDRPVQLYRVDLDNIGSATKISSSGVTSHKYPAWSPVDDRIAFACGGTDDLWYLCIMSASGGRMTNTGVFLGSGKEVASRISGRVAHFGRPSWSPDGRFIVYGGNPYGGNWDIWLYEVDTGELYNVTNTPNSDEMHPSWER